MPLTAKWLVADRVILTEYSGDFTVEDLDVMFKQVVSMMDESSAETVHIVTNLENLGRTPTNIAALRPVVKDFTKHPRLGWSFAYGIDKPIVSFITTMLTQIFPVRFRMVKTRDEALKLLAGLDQSLESMLEE